MVDVNGPRGLASRYPLRDAADRLVPTFSVALRAAFSVARKKSDKVAALEAALKKVLPGLLRRGVLAGGETVTTRLRAAVWDESKHPRKPAGSVEGGEFTESDGGSSLDDQGRFTSGVGFDDDPWERYPNAPDTKGYQERDVKPIKNKLKRAGRLNADGTVSLYHATLSEPEEIEKRGLIPAFESAPGQDWQATHSPYATYFHLVREPAERDIEFGGSVVEARIPITAKTLMRFIPDEDTSPNIYRGVDVLISGGGAVAFIGGVPASAVKIVKTNKFRGAARKQLHMTFDATNPRIATWAKAYAAELVTLIADATREAIRDAVARHAAGDLNDAEFSDALDAAVGDEARAETIARTESMRAVHQGQREAWAQAVDEGLLDAGMQRTWIVTPDDKLCPICEPLDGATASLEGDYAEGIEAPPAHPNCRCTEGLA